MAEYNCDNINDMEKIYIMTSQKVLIFVNK